MAERRRTYHSKSPSGLELVYHFPLTQDGACVVTGVTPVENSGDVTFDERGAEFSNNQFLRYLDLPITIDTTNFNKGLVIECDIIRKSPILSHTCIYAFTHVLPRENTDFQRSIELHSHPRQAWMPPDTTTVSVVRPAHALIAVPEMFRIGESISIKHEMLPDTSNIIINDVKRFPEVQDDYVFHFLSRGLYLGTMPRASWDWNVRFFNGFIRNFKIYRVL